METITPDPPPEHPAIDWRTASAQLGELDSVVVRYIAGDLSEPEFRNAQHRVLVDLRRRVNQLLAKHLPTASLPLLESLPPNVREGLALQVLNAELDEIETSPGELTPLRPAER